MPSRAPPCDEPHNSSHVTSQRPSISVFRWLAPRLQFEIDRHEIVIGGAAQQNRRPRRDDRRGSRDRTKLADCEPIKFWPHRSRNQSGKSESRTIGYVGALDLESALS